MERHSDDVNLEAFTPNELDEMEERRIAALDEAGIDEQKVLTEAKERKNIWTGYFNENITRGKDDLNFVLRDQWTAVERSEFTRNFKPAMTFNKLYDPIKKLIGEQRNMKPDLIVRSLTGHASQEDINLRADLVRTIAYQSQNDLVYQAAFRSALLMGFGAFQVCLDYESPHSFNKIVRYEAINDPTLCAWDPSAIKPHKGDGNYCSRNYIMSRDEFFATFPYVENPVSFIDPYMLLDYQWLTRDTICVCDEFIKDWFPLIIYKLSNGESVTESEWRKREKKFEDMKEFSEDSITGEIISREIPRIVGERQTQDYKIMHYRLIRDRIIDFSEWPSKQLPIPFVDGDSYFVEGRQYTKSFIHEGRDAQKAFNYTRSEMISEIKNRVRPQWLGTPDNIIGNEQQWRNPELQQGILIAKPDPKNGMMPTKMPAWDVTQGLFPTSTMLNQDMKEILGYSENEEMQGRDISGKARRERKVEGSKSAEVFFSNLNQAIEQGGRIVNDLLNYIYDENEPRHTVVTRKNGQSDSIVINEQDGEKIKNHLKPGDFDVEIDVGPSFAVQKEMALEFLQQTLQAFPQAFPLVADLWAKNLDVQFMPQMAERFKTLVPPEIIAKEEGKPPPPPKPPSPEEQMMQAKMQNEQQELIERAQELKIREQKHELEKAELMLKAQEMQAKGQREAQRDQSEDSRAALDFHAKIAKILADMHKSNK
jgi:hypothetical protein